MLTIQVKNVNSHFEGFIPSKEVFKELFDTLAFLMMGAEYSEKYLAGEWDGFKRLFNTRTKTFPTGLLGLVCGVLDKNSIRYEIQDLRIRPKVTQPLKLSTTKKPRPYQLEAAQKALIYSRGIVEAATGAGKSFIITMILARLGLPAIVYVNTKDLLYQMIKNLEIIENSEGLIGQIGDGIVNPKLLTVTMVQTVYKALGVKYPKFDDEDAFVDPTELDATTSEVIVSTVKNSSVMIIDETQFLASDTFQLVANHSVNAFYRFGFSGTPWRSDNADLMLNAATGKKIFAITATQLINMGYLVAPDITMLHMPRDGAKGVTSYQSIYKMKVTENELSNDTIVEISKFFYENERTVLVLVQHISHGEILMTKLKTVIDSTTIETYKRPHAKERKIKDIEFLKGPVVTDKRKRIVELFQEKKIKILIATTLADCGLDIPSLDVLITASRGKSSTRIPQRIGRVLRLFEGKKQALVFDFADPAKYLTGQARERIVIYEKEPGFRIHHFRINQKIPLIQYLKGMLAAPKGHVDPKS